MKATGVIIRQSPLQVKETIEKITDVLANNGIKIYVHIDQQAEAVGKGITLNPLEYLLFGNPQRGGEIMKENPVVALDLPLKIIAWQDDEDKTWVAYNDADYLKTRFSLSEGAAELIDIDPLIIKILNR